MRSSRFVRGATWVLRACSRSRVLHISKALRTACACTARGGFGGEGRGAYRGSRGRPEVTAETSEEVYGAQLSAQDGEGGHRRRGGFRGRRGGPPGAGGPPFTRREFDRHSATGRGREAKKHGAGGHNWGQEESENHPVKPETVLAEDVAAKEQIPQDAQAAEEVRKEAEYGM